ncbi:MAG: hypothetical protein JOZ29_07460 [Deltaproteobacteria bacterium]|nr:hypothetical protein [Deltaproteobacteria bacterium]
MNAAATVSMTNSYRQFVDQSSAAGRGNRGGSRAGIIATIIAATFGVLCAAQPARADIASLPTVSWYETPTASGTENGNTFGGGPAVLFSMGCYNYDTANPKVVMIFDAAALPANGTVPTRGMISLPPATSANQPSFNSLGIAQGGVGFTHGITFVASTSGKTLMADTTSGGNIHCAASYRP